MRVAAAFDAVAARFADRPFLHVLGETAAAYAIPAGPITYAAAAAAIARLRDAYAGAGYGPGHRVGLMLENRPAFFLHWFALNGLGVSVVPLNPELRPAELDYLVAHSEIVLGVGCAHHLSKLAAIPTMAEDARPPAAPSAGVVAPDECALLYTSGTTGRPKGCALSNQSFLQTGRWYAALGGLAALRPGAERLLTPLPLVHMNAMSFSAMAMMLTGGCVIQLDRFHPRSWWSSVRESGRDDRPLSRRDAVDADGRAPPDPRDRDHALRFALRRRRRSPFARRFRAAVRRAAAGGVGDDRDRGRGGGDRQPRAAPCRHGLLRPPRSRDGGSDRR